VRRLVFVIVCALALPVSVARAWTWPVDGPVLRPFAFDHSSPYAGGQHRGVDLGAPVGTPVLAPVEGVVSFAGTVPNGGKTVSIQSPFGYTATLLHLGSIDVKRGAFVGEASVVGAVGADGDPPYVYFGVRVTSDPQGYVDPLELLPPRPETSTAGPSSVAPPAEAEAPAEPVVEAGPAEPVSAPAEPVVSPVPAVATVPQAEAAPVAPAAQAPAAPALGETGSVAAVPTPTAADDVSPGISAESEAPAPPVEAAAIDEVRPPAALELAPPAVDERAEAQPQAPAAPNESHPGQVAAGRPQVDQREGSDSVPAITRSKTSARATNGVRSPASIPASDAAADRAGFRLPLGFGALLGGVALAWAVRRRNLKKAARIMSIPEAEPNVARAEAEEDPRGAGLAVRGWEAAPRPRGRVRRAGGHLRALPPAQGQRRSDGEWDRRAWDAGDGDCGSRRRLAA
jgi:hypothetical protein